MDMQMIPVPDSDTLQFFIPSLLNAAKAEYHPARKAIDMEIRAKLEAKANWLRDEGKKDPAIDKVIVIFAPEGSEDPEIKELVVERDRLTALMYPTEACYDEHFKPVESSVFYALGIEPNDVFNMCDPEKVIDMGPRFATVLSGEELAKFKQRLVLAWEHADRLSAKMLALHVVKCAGCTGDPPFIPKDYESTLEKWSSVLNEKYRSLLILLQRAERIDAPIIISPPVDYRLIL